MDTIFQNTNGFADSIALKFIGCFIKITMTTGTIAGDYSLGYFVGFDLNNLEPPSDMKPVSSNDYKDSNFITINSPTAVQSALAGFTKGLQLSIAPNPLRTTATLSYYLPQGMTSTNAVLQVYDIRGALQFSEPLNNTSGWNHQTFSATKPLSSGTYVFRLNAGTQSVKQYVTIIR